MATLDKSCRDIFAKYWRLHYPEGQELTSKFMNKTISKVEYFERIYANVDILAAVLTDNEIKDILCSQATYDFDYNKIIEKFERQKVVCITEPFLIKRIDSDGNSHFLLDACPINNDAVYKLLKLNPHTLSDVISFVETHNCYMYGINWAHTLEFSPSVFIFGQTKALVMEAVNSIEVSYA